MFDQMMLDILTKTYVWREIPVVRCRTCGALEQPNDPMMFGGTTVRECDHDWERIPARRSRRSGRVQFRHPDGQWRSVPFQTLRSVS